VEPGSHWQEASALTNAPSLLSRIDTTEQHAILRNQGLRMVKSESLPAFNGAQSGLVQIEKFSLNFSNLSIAIGINLLHPWSSLFLYGFLHFNNFLRGQNNSKYQD